MSSQCTNDGVYNLTVTFELGTDLNMAQVLVQNRVALATRAVAAAGPGAGRDREEEVAEHPAVRQPHFARRPLRRSVSEQLRHDPDQGRAAADRRRGRHRLPRPARLQPARLARSRQDGGDEPEHGRRDPGDPESERAGGRGANRPRADDAGPIVPVDDEHARPTRRRRAVSEHHPEDRRAEPGRGACLDSRRPPARRGPRRTRGAAIRPGVPSRRPAFGRAGGVSVAGLERPEGRRRSQEEDGGAEKELPRRGSTTKSSTTRPRSSSSRSAKSSRRCSRP